MRIVKTFGAGPSSIYLYESGEAGVPSALLKSADYFDVSMDYIFGCTDALHGMYCEAKPKVEQSYPEMNKFIEMCFAPSPPMNARMKETLRQMLNGLLEPFWKIAEIFT